MKILKFLERIPDEAMHKFIHKKHGIEIINILGKMSRGYHYDGYEYDLNMRSKEKARILMDFKGRDLFKDKELVSSIFFLFRKEELEKFEEHFKRPYEMSDDDFKEWLSEQKWKADLNDKFSKAVINFFELDCEDFFLNKVERKLPSSEVVNPKTTCSNNSRNYLPDINPLYPFQKETKDTLSNMLVSNEDNKIILHMPTGSGKTKTAIEAIIDYWRVKGRRQGYIVWFAHSKELCEQAYQTFKRIWCARGDYGICMYRVFGKHNPEIKKEGNGILFMGFQKYYNIYKNRGHVRTSLAKKVRLIVVDETHRAIAETYNESIKSLLHSKTNLLGLTATPGRKTDIDHPENYILNDMFNIHVSLHDDEGVELKPNLTEVNAIKYLQKKRYLAKINRKLVDSKIKIIKKDLTKEGNLNDNKKFEISEIYIRNRKILQEIEKAVIKRNETVLVFATSISHALALEILLRKIYNIEAQCILGNTPNSKREKAITRFRNEDLPVLINYNILTAGFDSPRLGTLVISRVTESIVLYSQMLGRALRGPKMGGREINTVIDMKENHDLLGNEYQAFEYFADIYSN